MSTNKQQIIDYVLKTPHNTNKLVLSGLLDSFKGNGATPSPSTDTEKPAVRLLDWEGTTLQTYTTEEALNLISLPNPSTLEGYNDIDHEYLVFQTWNWDLEDIKNWIDDNPGFTLPVGAIYNTSDGENHQVIYGEKLEGISNTRDYIIALKIGDMSTVDFSEYEDLKYITIPQGTTNFNNYDADNEVFYEVPSLLALNVPSSIEQFNFEYSYDVDIEDGVILSFPKQIDNFHLRVNGTFVQELVLPSGGDITGWMRSNELVLPKNLLSIMGYDDDITDLYFKESLIKTLALPEGLKYIGYGAFEECKSVEEIIFPSSLEEIATSGFYEDNNLKNVVFPANLTTIGASAFYNTALTNITIPDSVTEIGYQAFSDCDKLKNITLSSNLVELGYGCFQGCNNLEKIEIPSTIEGINNDTFSYCSKLKDVLIKGEIPLSNLNGFPLRPFAIVRVYVPANSIEYYRTQTNWAAMYVDGFILPIEDNIEYLESIGFNVDEFKGSEENPGIGG